MPVVTISKISDQTKTSAKGKKYKVTVVEGTKYGSEDAWETKIFKNQKDLLDQLEEFGPGETANFKFKKNGNFYDLYEISEPTEENLAYAKQGGQAGKGGATSGGGYNGRTGEQWNRSAAIYLAVDIAKENKTAKGKVKMEDVMELAGEIYDYIQLGHTQYDNPFAEGEGGDPLDPPDVD